jgi:membrane protease subunit HflK
MSNLLGRGGRIRGLFGDTKGPWGPSGSGDGGDDSPPESGGSGPWGEPSRKPRRAGIGPGSNVTSLDELFRRGRLRFGGGGGGLPDRSLFFWAILGFILLWLVFTSFHSVSPGQRGVVTRFGRYSYTLGPGVGLTLPSPIDRVKKIDVENIRNVDLGSDSPQDRC